MFIKLEMFVSNYFWDIHSAECINNYNLKNKSRRP